LGGRIWLVYLALPVMSGELEPNFISYLFDLLVDTQAVAVQHGSEPRDLTRFSTLATYLF
jgi:hypothetical protein